MSYHSLFQFGMKGVVERYGDKELKQQYKQSAHEALCDAKALGKICTGSYLGQNFREFLEDRDGEINWEFQDLLRPPLGPFTCQAEPSFPYGRSSPFGV